MPVPEDFGAIGDGATLDDDALEAFFGSQVVENLNESIALELTPGKTYRFERPKVIAPTSGNNFQLHLDGHGGVLHYAGSAGIALQLGEAPNRKAFYSSISNVYIAGEDGIPFDTTGLSIDFADFSILRNVRVTGFGTAVMIQRSNSNSWFDVSLNGQGLAGTCVVARNIVNVFNWTGGKVQQAEVGIDFDGSTFNIAGIDLSIITETAVNLRNSSGNLRIYSESIGNNVRDDTAAVVRMNNCDGVHVSGLLNCVPENAGGSWSTNIPYAARLTDSSGITFRATAVRPQRGYVSLAGECRDITIEHASNVDSNVSDELRTALHPLADTHVLRAPVAQFCADYASPGSPDPTETRSRVDQWSTNAGTVVLPETVTDYLGGADVPVVELRRNDGSDPSALSDNFGPANAGETWRFEGRVRLVRFLESDVQNQGTSMAILRPQLVALDSPGEVFRPRLRIFTGWQDFRFDWTVPTDTRISARLALAPAHEPIAIAVDFLRVHRVN